MFAEVCGQGVASLDPGAAIDFVDHHVNDQVELVRCAPDLNDLELGALHHLDLDVVAVIHVGLLAVRRDANQLACPLGEERIKQLDEYGLLVGGRVVVEVQHGDQVQVVQDVVHADTDVDVEEHRAVMLVAIKRQCKRPQIIAHHDVADDLQGVGDQDSHILFDNRVVEAAELGNLVGVLGLLDRRRDLPERQVTRHVLDGELEAHDSLDVNSVLVVVLV